MDMLKELTGDHPSLGTALVAVAGLCGYWVFAFALRRMRKGGALTRTMEMRLRVVLRWVIFAAVVLLVLEREGLITDAWALFSGFLAVAAVGLVATWSVLSNAVCAVILLVYRPFEIGDMIEVLETSDKPGFRGRVSDINLIFTRLVSQESGDGENVERSVLQVPNNMLLQRIVRRVDTNPKRDSLY